MENGAFSAIMRRSTSNKPLRKCWGRNGCRLILGDSFEGRGPGGIEKNGLVCDAGERCAMRDQNRGAAFGNADQRFRDGALVGFIQSRGWFVENQNFRIG